MAYKTIVVDIEEYVALIRLNRPEAMNALNTELLDELADAVLAADANEKVRCLVLTGSGKAFAAGADIKEMAEKSFVEVFGADLFTDPSERLLRCRKPIIAAVSGYALGGGCELAMMCDFIIAADTAKFGQPEINLGTMPGLGGSQRLTRFVGKSKAMDMNLTGRFMDAAEAERSGLVSRVVPAIRQVLTEAIEAGGSSLRDYRRADGELGYFQHAFRVYDREGAPCPAPGCGGTIRRIVQSGRSTFYCPDCQR